ncbi:5'-nucleotidase [Intrasporangium calvum]|uniref:5'-nucleotidase n=1 Tax=Intrasporangium calvum TaxID=53358 RepID=A0ABT5GM78_9MICO|nr:5'-nucleotidase [Intrasporangium calvum]MDC5698985.1 5'-nucleotidase [Intrasporangium calvum]
MAGPGSDTLVIGVASSALFDLAESHAVFEERGEDAYREFQEENYEVQLQPGIAFPFIKRLLSLNDLRPELALVEVVVLSRNDPETGARVMRSIETHGLPMTRAVFMQGRSPFKFMPAFGMKLFLSGNPQDVAEATSRGYPAGQVVGVPAELAADTSDDVDLRIAFDFDAVLADDSAEQVFDAAGLEGFRSHEVENAAIPLPPGPMKDLLGAVNKIQDLEDAKSAEDGGYKRRLFVSIVTARNAPAHTRAIRTLKSWGLRVNDAFFLGGWEKAAVLRILKPHIFFDDQMAHLAGTQTLVPSVHVPFGVKNRPSAAREASDRRDLDSGP